MTKQRTLPRVPRWPLERQLIACFVLVLVIMGIILLVSIANTRALIENSRLVSHTQAVLTELEGTQRIITDAETGQRGYIITGDSAFLAPYTTALTELNAHLQQLTVLTAGDAVQQQQQSVLVRAVAAKLDGLRPALQARREQGFEAARAIVASGQGQRDMDTIRRIVAQMKEHELAVLNTRTQQLEASAMRATWMLGGLTVLNFALLPLVYIFVRRDIRRRRADQHALAVARDQALEASRLKSDFLATMSHEIRTPMNAIIGMTDILLETPLDDDQREFAGIVRESGQALLTLINDILDFSKIEAGKLVLERVDFELRSVVEGVAEILAPKARDKSLSLMTFVDPTIPALQGDPNRLRQILINLVGNAIKFTEAGEVVVRAELERATEQELVICFTVRDTGIGISEDARARLFQPFTQADSSTTRTHGGTGLGLAISKRLVEHMHGEIGVTSWAGAGSVFWFTACFEHASGPIEQTIIPGQLDLPTARVLVVDDSETSRQIIRHYLAAWDLQADDVASGSAALAELRSSASTGSPYDLAVIDLSMPDMDGFAIARAIRRDDAIPDTPLILLTAFDERGQGEQALEAGFAAYLTKPVKQAHLLDAIASALRQHGTQLQAPSQRKTRSQTVRDGRQPADRSTTGRTILLVEDNIANQKVARVQLERLGYAVEIAANGREGVEALSRADADYALVLMDVQMPELDGYQATAAIRKLELTTGRHVPIVAMTANAMQGDREAALAAGMDDYISKPIDPAALRRILERWISAHKQ